MDSEDDFNWFPDPPVRNGRKYSRPMGPDAPHYMNKAERKELARLCQQSGLTPDEVRKNPDLRRRLSAAQKSASQPHKNPTDRYDLAVKRSRRWLAKYRGVEVWQLDGPDEVYRILRS